MKTFISAGHSKENTEEGKTTKLIRDEVKKIFLDAIYVPDDLTLSQKVDWINERADKNDFALDIHLNYNDDKNLRGVEAYFDNNMNDAMIISECVATNMHIPNRGAKHDSLSFVGSLGFLRLISCDSIVIECGYQSNEDDRNAIFFRKNIAKGIIEGLERIGKIQNVEKDIITFQKKVIVLLKQLLKLLMNKG